MVPQLLIISVSDGTVASILRLRWSSYALLVSYILHETLVKIIV